MGDGLGRPSPLLWPAVAPGLPEPRSGLVPGPRHGLYSFRLASPGFFSPPASLFCFLTRFFLDSLTILFFFPPLSFPLFLFDGEYFVFSLFLLSVYRIYHFGAVTLSEAGHSQGPGYFSAAGLPQECVQFPGTPDKFLPNFSQAGALRSSATLPGLGAFGGVRRKDQGSVMVGRLQAPYSGISIWPWSFTTTTSPTSLSVLPELCKYVEETLGASGLQH